MKALLKTAILLLIATALLQPASLADAASVAVFPLQELGESRNDANLPLTRLLVDELVESGNEVISLRTIINFMANNRIRGLGHLDTHQIEQVRKELGAAFILLGTVSQRRERPEPSLGLTLTLLRASDQRPVWSFIDSLSRSDERRVLGVGEPDSVAELNELLLAELSRQWPWRIINQVQPTETVQLEMARLEPRQVRPGGSVGAVVGLRDARSAERAPRIFFKADEQLYPATPEEDGRTWRGSWIAGPDSGNYVVSLVVEWPDYGRSETALLGSYVIDGTPPVLSMELRGVEMIDNRAVFNRQVTIVPRLLLRKALSRWRLSFFAEGGDSIGATEGEGSLPGSLIWSGKTDYGRVEPGVYQVVLEVWDLAGNSARAEEWVEFNRSMPLVSMAIEETARGASVDLTHEGKIPLEMWRMELWTSEGKILARQEGRELPNEIELELAGAKLDASTRGFLFTQDVLGNQVRRELADLLPDLGKEPETEADAKPEKLSEKWVDEF